MGSTPVPLTPEALRRARDTPRGQIVSLDDRLEEAGKAARECAKGRGIATAIADAQGSLSEALEKLDVLIRDSP